MRPQKHWILLATAVIALAAAGCAHNDTPDNAAATNNAHVSPAAQKQATGGTGGVRMAQPMAAPPGFKTGDLSGGRK